MYDSFFCITKIVRDGLRQVCYYYYNYASKPNAENDISFLNKLS